jgi:pimeloyl-ACP methyl ester carboxylesterase
MPVGLSALLTLTLLGPAPLAPVAVETKFIQVAPPAAAAPRRSPGRTRAVVLLHGLRPHPFSETNVATPDLSGWAEAGSMVVTTLGAESDVYALGYSQNAPVDDVARAPAVGGYVASLRAAGYAEVVMVGYSAGALVARYYVEDTGGGGVTKVVQVCPPNGGSGWSRLARRARKSQEVFGRSQCKGAKQGAMAARANRRVPPHVEFVCLVGAFGRAGDGLVRFDCQWPHDLQRQGIPAVVLTVPHLTAMRSKATAQKVAELVREPQPRWSAALAEQMRAAVLREK